LLLIYGATGATGARLAELATQAGIETVVAGRRAEEVNALAARVGCEARVATLAELPRVLGGVHTVASCVGPYTHVGTPVVEAAVAAGANYLDLTGEPHFVQSLVQRWDAPARAAGIALVPSAGLGTCSGIAARAAVDALPGPVREIVIGYQPRGMRASTGTVRSTVEILAGGALVARGGRTCPALPGSRLRRTPYGPGALFPLTDPVTLHTVWPAADISGYFVSRAAPAIAPVFLGLRGTGRVAIGALRVVERRLRGFAKPGGGFRIGVRATDGTAVRDATVELDDIYELTSLAALEVAQCLLSGTDPGVRSSAAVVGDPDDVARRIGVRLTAP
jgi:hypothetical protein